MTLQCLVTGGSGYFGAILVKSLLAEGNHVRVLDLYRAPDLPPDVDFVRADIRDRDQVLESCRGMNLVFHNVAQVPLARNRHLFETVNIDGTAHLLEGALRARVEKVVHTSSSAVFGIPLRNPVDYRQEPHPEEDYSRAKLAGEKLCEAYSQKGLDVTIIRPRTILGQGRLGIMQVIFEWALRGWNLPVLDGGDNVYQCIHALDLADACIRAATVPGPACFNIGAERFGTLRETLEGLLDHAGNGGRVVSLPATLAEHGMRLSSLFRISPLGAYHALMYGKSMYFDIGPARSVLNWHPRFSNIEMFCDSYDWYVRHRSEVLRETGSSPHRAAVRHGILSLVGRGLSWR